MSNTNFDLENVIPVTEANLRDEQKQAMVKAMEEYKQQCLKSFSINRSGEVIQKEALPAPRQITFEANPSKLQDMVDNAINRALINQAGVLSNTVFNAVARTFKEGQVPPTYVGPAYHQPWSSVVTAPSATTAVAGTEATSPPSTLGITNAQSTPMTTNPSTSDEQIKLATDLLASAMSGSVPPNWWGYGMPSDLMVKTPGTSQVADVTGKAPMASAPPNVPMNQSPQYTTTTTARPYTGNSQAPTFQMPNASANPMPTQQRFMIQPGYVNSMMMPNYQSSGGPIPMNANNGWTGQLVFPQMPQQNHEVVGFQQGQIQPGFQNQGLVNQPVNLGQQIGGQMINPMFHTDRAPQRHVEAYQQVPDPQPPHRQDADAYWADKIEGSRWRTRGGVNSPF